MSKTTIQMQRRGQRLECVSPVWADLLEEFPQGVDLNVAITRARSLSQLGTYWGALDWAVKNVEAISTYWFNKDTLSGFLQIEVGFVQHIAIPQPKGEAIYVRVPLSKSFAECSQENFNQYFEAAMVELAKRAGCDVLGLYLDWMRDRGSKAA